MKAVIAPSLLSADLANAANVAQALEGCGITWLHLDVMDGNFVPNITFGAPFIASMRKTCGLFFDVHLMIAEPGRYVEAFARAGADIIVPHLEAMSHPQKSLAAIKDLGIRAGVALNPDTDPFRLRWLLPYLDMVLVMGVNPGFSGQSFLPETIAKIKVCRQFLAECGYGNLPIQIDGGTDAGNAKALAEAGANVLVSGSAFFRHKDYFEARAALGGCADAARLDADTENALLQVSLWRSRQSQ